MSSKKSYKLTSLNDFKRSNKESVIDSRKLHSIKGGTGGTNGGSGVPPPSGGDD